MKTTPLTLCLALGGLTLGINQLHADEVTDWNANLLQAAHVANSGTLPLLRIAAIMHTAIFDSLNGIERRYTPIHVPAEAPRGASRRAAVIQAAYGTLVHFFPSQKTALDAEREASLASIVDDGEDLEDSVSIARGLAWGQSVADAILAWRSTDGFSDTLPPFVGGSAAGEWRPTPPGFLAGALPQIASETPWVLSTQDQFRPAGPPALDSAQYATDVNEVQSTGSLSSPVRTTDQTLFARFWQASTVTYFWNSVAESLALERGFSLSRNARLFALLNVAIADANIACWEAKYYYVFWRPITAIRLADTDGNDATVADPTWTPLLVTPNHPDYPSGHATTGSAAATVLADFFGNESPLAFDSDVMTGVLRSFSSFSDAVTEIKNARVFAGIHFRTACNDGQATGNAVAEYVLQHAAQALHGQSSEQADD